MIKNPLIQSAISSFLGLGFSVGEWHSNELAIFFWIVAMVLSGYAVWDWFRFPHNWKSIRELSFDSKIALDKAARIFYEEARAIGSVWAPAAERLGTQKSPEGILDYLATYIASKAKLFGKRPPSTRIEEIPISKAKNGKFSNGAKILEVDDEAHTAFVDLKICKKDFKKVLLATKEALEKFVSSNGIGSESISISVKAELVLAYKDIKFTSYDQGEKTAVAVTFVNNGNIILKIELREIYFSRNNEEGQFSPDVSGNIHPNEERIVTAVIAGLPKIDPSLPATIRVGFTAVYDNIPPIKKRYCARHLRYSYSSLNPAMLISATTEKEEDGFVD